MTEHGEALVLNPARPLRWGRMVVWAAVLCILALLGWGLVNSNAGRPEDVAPDFQMRFFDGYRLGEREAASLSDLRGQVVVVNFWASWCVECRVEAELLESAWRAYRDRGVVFIGIAYVDAEPKSLQYLAEFDITYPNAPDLRSAISHKYQITGVPETFFIGKDGRVAYVEIGPVSPAVLNGLVEQLLAEDF